MSGVLAVCEATRLMAILERIDAELDARGLLNRKGKPSYLIDQRAWLSKQLGRWLEKVTAAIER